MLSTSEAVLHPVRLTDSLARAAELRGVRILAGRPATGIRHGGSLLQGVETPDGEIAAGEVVIASGAWSRMVCSWFGFPVPIPPTRGQMLAVRPSRRVLRHQVLSDVRGLMPRRDGSVYVGATGEHVGFGKRNTPEGLAQLVGTIDRLMPNLGDVTFERCWAGLRPWCEDGHPVIGRLPGWRGVTVASGHAGMGITACPLTAAAVTTLVTRDRVDPVITPFSPERISRTRPPAT